MNSNRKNEVVVGVLFIMATVFGVIAASIFTPVLNSPDYLIMISANENQMVIGTMLYFFMAMSCAGIGLALYPLLKKYSEILAIGTVGFRVIEGMIQVIGAIIMICLLALSREFVKAGVPTNSYFQVIGAILKAGNDWIGNGAMLLPWCIGALMYYFVFYKFRLIPRWLSVWGLVGITLTIISSLLIMINPVFGTVQTAANLPIALQEMVFAVWLIIKGINPSAIDIQSA